MCSFCTSQLLTFMLSTVWRNFQQCSPPNSKLLSYIKYSRKPFTSKRRGCPAPACSLVCSVHARWASSHPGCFWLPCSYTKAHCGAGPVALVLWWPNVAQPISGNKGPKGLILSLKPCPFQNMFLTVLQTKPKKLTLNSLYPLMQAIWFFSKFSGIENITDFFFSNSFNLSFQFLLIFIYNAW